MNPSSNRPQTLLFLLFIFLGASCAQKHYQDALSPEDEIRHFEVAGEFGVELFASEPVIRSPVDMIWDEEGNNYVIEMGDYPYKPEAGKAKGRILVLQDRNQDGRIDTSIVFAAGLSSATSMLPWKGGLIVTAAPDILYLKDTNGDLHADIRDTLFTGFFANNSEVQITSLRFGVDNWIYANNQGQQGEVRDLRNPAAPALHMGGSDFRFRMDKALFEKESGSGQFGLAVDDWGHRFYTHNTLHIQQAPIREKYLHRHAFLPSDNAEVNISDHDPLMFQKTQPPYWRLERSRRRQKEYDDLKLDRKEFAEGHFTGAAGGTFYGGDAFPAPFYGSIFTGDVSGNLVHRDSLVPGNQEPVYVAKRAAGERDREFLASTDPWFRPVNFTSGPDGCLYMVDMYRQHIETPVSIPDDLKKDMDFTNGDQYGRIFRIVPKKGTKPATANPGLRRKRSAELVALLAHPNQWYRLQAHRLLLERQDRSVMPLLKSMFETYPDPRARIHALYVLEGLEALDMAMVARAMKDAEPGIREQAVILSERYPQLLPQLLEMTGDSSVQVVFQVTLSLGQFADPHIVPALAKLLERHAGSSLFRTAVLSAEAGSSPEFLQVLISQGTLLKDPGPEKTGFLKDLSYVIGARNKQEQILAFAGLLSQPEIKKETGLQVACLEGLSRGLADAGNKNKATREILTKLEKDLPMNNAEIKAAVDKVRQAIGDTLTNR